MSVCICASEYLCACVYAYMCRCVYVDTCICMHMNMYVRVSNYASINVYVCVSAKMYDYEHVYLYV